MTPVIKSQNGKIKIRLTPLVENADEATSLSADVAAAASTLTVLNINKFAINKILLIGELGDEQSEIIKTHASSAPSGSTVTLAANLVFELSHATTVGGSKTVLTTTLLTGLVALEADEKQMIYNETEFSSGFYYARYKDSIAATYSDYCDAVAYGDFTETTAGAVIDYALRNSKVKQFDLEITREWCYEQITDMFRYVQGKQKRWNKYQNLNAVLGTSARGTRKVAVPTDMYDLDSNRSLKAVRFGTHRNLEFKDPEEFEDVLFGLAETTVSTQAAVGAITMVLTDSDDFADSGTVSVFLSGTLYDITYTGITRATHTLTGIPASGTGSITAIIAAATNIFQNYTEGEPAYYTLRNQYIEFYPMPSDLFDNLNIFADYWTIADTINSDSDLIDVERFDMAKYWMTWKMRAMKKNEGKLDYDDGDYKMFADRLKDAIGFKGPLLKYKMKPRLNGISYRGYGRTRRAVIGNQ